MFLAAYFNRKGGHVEAMKQLITVKGSIAFDRVYNNNREYLICMLVVGCLIVFIEVRVADSLHKKLHNLKFYDKNVDVFALAKYAQQYHTLLVKMITIGLKSTRSKIHNTAQ